MRQFLSFLFFLSMITSCGTADRALNPDSPELGASTISNQSQAETLVDQLRKIPGVNVEGDGGSASIKIRGISTLYGSNEPLFIVNGQPLNGGLREAMQLSPASDIKSIRVLKNPSDIAMYGVRGGNGVIIIKLK